MTPRDLRIFDRARELPHGDFERAVENLHRAVEELIPAGRLWPLGRTEHGPIIGSRITGLGIAPSPGGVVLVEVRAGIVTPLGELLVKATLELDVAAVDDAAIKQLLLEWREVDWLQRGTSVNAAAAARLFATHLTAAHDYAPDLFPERVNVIARISSWAELASLCDAVRGRGATWDWKFEGLKRLTYLHSKAHGWSLQHAPPGPFFTGIGENNFWTLTTTVDLRELPPASREPANCYMSYTAIDLTHAIEWQLAEPDARLDENPFVPLLRCYATGFLPFMLDRDTASLWAPA